MFFHSVINDNEFFQSDICSKEFVTFDGPFEIDGQEVPVIITELLVEKPEKAPKNGQWNTCVQCGGKFKGRNQILKHQRTMHPATNTGTVLCRFPSCAYVCHRIQQLVDHMKQAHMLEVVTTEHRFDCEEDFLMWKEDYEMMNNSQYRLTSSKFQSTCRYFNCSRSGFYNPKEDKKRRAKSQGTSKMNGHCISGMVVKTDEYGAVNVVFSETHYGHDTEVNHLRLGARTRNCMKQQLRAGLSEEFVCAQVNTVRRNENKPPISKKDVQNVAYTLQNQILDTEFNFKTEYAKWNVDSCKLNLKDNILFHKAQGQVREDCKVLDKDDFVLCCMTDKQFSNLHRLAERGLCIQVCLGSNNSVSMCLVVVMAYEPSKKNNSIIEEVPLAWCLSNVDHYRVKKVFFESIRDCCEATLRTPFLLTNEWSECYEAWCSVFKDGPDHIISPWAVDNAVVNAAKQHVIGEDQRQMVISEIRTLVQIEDLNIFNEHLKYLLQEFGTMAEFVNFFRKYFTDRFVSCGNFRWARSYYSDHVIGVDNFCAALESVLPKLHSDCNKKVGRCANHLMRAYTLRRHHLDATFVRRRKRMKREDLIKMYTYTTNHVLISKITGRLHHLKHLLASDLIPSNKLSGFADTLVTILPIVEFCMIPSELNFNGKVRKRISASDNDSRKKFKPQEDLNSCTSLSTQKVGNVSVNGNGPARRLLSSGSAPGLLRVSRPVPAARTKQAIPPLAEHNDGEYIDDPMHRPTFLHPVVISEEVVPATEEECAAHEMSFEEAFILEDDSIGLVIKEEPQFKSEGECVIEHVISNEEELDEWSGQIEASRMDQDEVPNPHFIAQEVVEQEFVPAKHVASQEVIVQNSMPIQHFLSQEVMEQEFVTAKHVASQEVIIQNSLPLQHFLSQEVIEHDSMTTQDFLEQDSMPAEHSPLDNPDLVSTQHFLSGEVQDNGSMHNLLFVSEDGQSHDASSLVAIKMEPDEEGNCQMVYLVAEQTSSGQYEKPLRRRRSARAC